MTIFNRTANTIKITSRDIDPTEIKPNESFHVFSRMYDVISIHSKDGSCIIAVAFGERNIECFGKMWIDEDGPKNVVVYCG